MIIYLKNRRTNYDLQKRASMDQVSGGRAQIVRWLDRRGSDRKVANLILVFKPVLKRQLTLFSKWKGYANTALLSALQWRLW